MALLLLIVLIFVTFILVGLDLEDCAVIPGFLCFGALAMVIISIFNIADGRVIDSKITMYQAENKSIEREMDVLVEKYMDYESKTLGELKGESSITLVSLYPELKADELVKQQVKIYIRNNKKIKELKEAKIDLSVWKWWLYFGK